MAARGVLPGAALWAIVAVALAAGVATLPSVGSLLILFAVLLALLAPAREEPRSFWPLATGLVVFVVGYLLVAPARCTEGAVSTVGGEQRAARFCESLAGIPYEREGTEDPSQLPAFAAALGGGLLVAGVLRLIVRERGVGE